MQGFLMSTISDLGMTILDPFKINPSTILSHECWRMVLRSLPDLFELMATPLGCVVDNLNCLVLVCFFCNWLESHGALCIGLLNIFLMVCGLIQLWIVVRRGNRGTRNTQTQSLEFLAPAGNSSFQPVLLVSIWMLSDANLLCLSVAPKSHVTSVGSFGSKNFSSIVSLMIPLRWLNCFELPWSNCQRAFFEISCRSMKISSERWGMNFYRYATMSRNRCRSAFDCGSGMSRIAWTFSGSRRSPSPVSLCPKNVISVAFVVHLSLFNLSWLSRILNRTCLDLVQSSCLVDPHTIISSWLFLAPSHVSMMSAIVCWKISLALCTPNGSLLNRYLPNGVANVKSFDDSSSTLICQYPLLVSAW